LQACWRTCLNFIFGDQFIELSAQTCPSYFVAYFLVVFAEHKHDDDDDDDDDVFLVI